MFSNFDIPLNDESLLIFVVFPLVAALAFVIFAVMLQLKARKYKKNGIIVSAELLEKLAIRGGHNRYIYKFLVAYRVDGVKYEKQIDGTSDEYGTMMAGDKLEIIVPQDKPEECAMKSVTTPKWIGRLYFFAVIFIAFGIGAYFFIH